MATADARELCFVAPSPEEYLQAFLQAAAAGRRCFLLEGDGAGAAAFLERAKAQATSDVEFFTDSADRAGAAPEAAAVMIFGDDAVDVSKRLAGHATDRGGLIIAPITAHYWRRRPAFINSIPKSGTHLLIELMRALGYSDPPRQDMPDSDGPFLGGTFYNLQHMTAQTLARPFAQIQPLVHALTESVVLFICRDPRDIAVSMAHYLAGQKEYHVLQHYFEELRSDEDRLAAVIEGKYPVPVFINRHLSFSGSLRDLVMLFEPWLRSPPANMCLVRFEDLVGAAGGGSDAAQHDAVWQLQLALHVGGRPAELAKGVFSTRSATFRRGQIGSHAGEFSPRHWELLRAMDQDFLRLLQRPCGPVRCIPEGFQGCLAMELPEGPSLVERYRGYNIVYCRRQFHAVGDVGPLDLATADLSVLDSGAHFEAASLRQVKELVDGHLTELQRQRDCAQDATLAAQARAIDLLTACVKEQQNRIAAMAAQLDGRKSSGAGGPSNNGFVRGVRWMRNVFRSTKRPEQ
ncbi:MAG: sulfotransferase domain-containing protein [Planctomycetaceae bacterium]|nr:sulfotransferase domain-containing protein [Planctomycetaceae bacterium]